ncbi:MAG: sirohydrochlorin cobaltochelatase [Candidatus Methanomethylophilaceae archaeon]|nr:sirohydrochlorin cobaltochelatase [Candidatus Methanomethylophilaceae archaeon]
MPSTSKAILVVSFGTSYNDNREKTIGAIERLAAERFPDWEVRRAFTSKMIIKKLKTRDGEHVDYVDEALDRLLADGYKEVVVQPTHVMNGIEYEFVRDISMGYSDRFDSLVVGKPLLTSPEDYDVVVEALSKTVIKKAKTDLGPDSAVVLMGHGTEHYSNATYSQLQLKLLLAGYEDVFVTTVEGFPDFEDTISLMEGHGIKDVLVTPFMLVAGDHANTDMAGDDDDSLKNVLSSKGYHVTTLIMGLGEWKEFQEMFMSHIGDAVSETEKE